MLVFPNVSPDYQFNMASTKRRRALHGSAVARKHSRLLSQRCECYCNSCGVQLLINEKRQNHRQKEYTTSLLTCIWNEAFDTHWHCYSAPDQPWIMSIRLHNIPAPGRCGDELEIQRTVCHSACAHYLEECSSSRGSLSRWHRWVDCHCATGPIVSASTSTGDCTPGSSESELRVARRTRSWSAHPNHRRSKAVGSPPALSESARNRLRETAKQIAKEDFRQPYATLRAGVVEKHG